MELWDAYDCQGNRTGRFLVRGEPVPEGLFHMVCEVLVRHTDGSILCMKRSLSKPNYPGYYEATAGGSALLGESADQCIRRELREETGIRWDEFEYLGCVAREQTRSIYHSYIATVDWDKENILLQEGETEDFCWMTEGEFQELLDSCALTPEQFERFLPYFRRMGWIKPVTNENVWRTAYEQSAIDCNCAPEDFKKDENVMTLSRPHPAARKYLSLPFACDLVSYGRNIVAQTSPELADVVRQYLDSYPVAHAFETPNLHALDEALRPHGLKTCFMAEYFLPDVDAIREQPCAYRMETLTKAEFQNLYLPQWSNALCADRAELDVLAVGAYDGEKLIGLAGCSADCKDMYQIGVDVLPEYRRQGVAAALTSGLALEILKRGKVPFYCAAWCNLTSVRNAIRCGFRPAWVTLTARNAALVDKLNGREAQK